MGDAMEDEGCLFYQKRGRKQSEMCDKAPVAKRRSQAEKRCHDGKVDRLLDEQFPDFPSGLVNKKNEQGMSLRLEVAHVLWPDEEDKVRHMSETKRAALRLKYAEGNIAEVVLKETEQDKKNGLNRKLQADCEKATHKSNNVRDRKPLQTTLRTLRKYTLEDIKLLFRSVMCVRPSADPELCAFVIQIMRWVISQQIHLKYRKETHCLLHVWRDALRFMYNQGQKTEESLHAYFRKYGDLFPLATEHTDKAKALLTARKSQFKDHMETLRVICQEKLLDAMFGWARPKAAADHMEDFIQSLLVYPEGRQFTAADYDRIVGLCAAEGERVGATEVLNKKNRPIVVPYGSMKGKHFVSDLNTEVLYRMESWLRSTNVGGDIPPMKYELMIRSVPDNVPKGRVAMDLLANNIQARQDVDEFLSDKASTAAGDLDSVQALLSKNRGVWLGVDPWFSIEITMLAGIFGAAGTEHLINILMEAFPTAASPSTPSETMKVLEEIKSSRWFPFIQDDGKEIFKSLHDFVKPMTQGDSPEAIDFLESTPYYRKIKSRVDYFTQWPDGTGGLVFGPNAVVRMLDHYMEQIELSKEVVYGDLDDLAIFEFLLPSDRVRDLEDLRGVVVEAMEKKSQEEQSEVAVPPLFHSSEGTALAIASKENVSAGVEADVPDSGNTSDHANSFAGLASPLAESEDDVDALAAVVFNDGVPGAPDGAGMERQPRTPQTPLPQRRPESKQSVVKAKKERKEASKEKSGGLGPSTSNAAGRDVPLVSADLPSSGSKAEGPKPPRAAGSKKQPQKSGRNKLPADEQSELARAAASPDGYAARKPNPPQSSGRGRKRGEPAASSDASKGVVVETKGVKIRRGMENLFGTQLVLK